MVKLAKDIYFLNQTSHLGGSSLSADLVEILDLANQLPASSFLDCEVDDGVTAISKGSVSHIVAIGEELEGCQS